MKLYRWTAEYEQDKDTWDSNDEDQLIKFEAEDATGEGDMYITFSTNRWALDVDEIDDFANAMKEFLKANLVKKIGTRK